MATSEVLGRKGETKAHMMAWFYRRGFWRKPGDSVWTVLAQMNAFQLDILAGAVTHYGLQQVRAVEADEKCYRDLAASGGIIDAT